MKKIPYLNFSICLLISLTVSAVLTLVLFETFEKQQQRIDEQLQQINNMRVDYSQLYNRLSSSVGIVKTDKGLGTGVVILDGTYVVTAHHVINGAEVIKFEQGGAKVPLMPFYEDVDRDIAVLRLKGFKYEPVKLRATVELKIGEEIVIIGNPYGLEDTFHIGMVSGLGRNIPKSYTTIVTPLGVIKIPFFYTKVVQLDANSAPGFSGGGIFDINGNLVAILTMGANGVTLAQPTDVLMNIKIEETKEEKIIVNNEVKVTVSDTKTEETQKEETANV